MGKHIKGIAVLVWLVAFTFCGYSQKPYYLEQSDRIFYEARDLFDKEQYGAARQYFARYLSGENTPLLEAEARYYRALCAIELFNDDASYLLYAFISDYPGSPLINQALYRMGKLAYRDRQYRYALEWFARVDSRELGQEERAEFFFKKGYCHFRREEYMEARVAFYEILDTEADYAAPARYYYSHIHYEQENFETALKGFKGLSDDENFAPIVPYYITQIYHKQKNWPAILEYAPPLLETVTAKRQAEMNRIIGEAYFYEDRYPEAVKHLEIYHNSISFTQPEDKYQLAFAYYQTGAYEQAIQYFKMISTGKKELSQSALYHMGDCYIRTGDKYQARLSFDAASRLDFDPEIKEDALFNYAVVTYELSMSPFNEAIRGLQRYISLYPASDRTDEAYNYLVLAFMGAKNYRAALASLENIQRRTPEIERAYQRVAFFRGLELFKDLSFELALEAFDASLRYQQYDRSLKALARYWKGESWYRLENYDEALGYYAEFQGTEGATGLNEFAVSFYNSGYCLFKQERYREALNAFKRFESLNQAVDSRILGDAYNRIADMYFIQANYARAIAYYQESIDHGTTDVDYAVYQKGICHGVMNRHAEKISVLEDLLESYPGSGFIPDALYEIGRSHFILSRAQQAIPYYQRILDEHPNSSYVSRALVQMGLIYYNLNQPEPSLRHYKRVVADFPGTPEASNALMGIRSVYMENNRVNEYFSYVNTLGGVVDIDQREQDSLTYVSAENIYMMDDCEAAIGSLEAYLIEFPRGIYQDPARIYLADCQLKEGEPLKALETLYAVIERPRNAYTEPALLTASRINFDYERYAEALETYTKLATLGESASNRAEARIGIMRCHFLMKQYPETIDAARQVLKLDKLSEELRREAHYKIATSFYEQQRFALALDEYREVAVEVSSLEGAESKYRVAEMLFIRKDYDEAEETVFEFIDMNTPHEYWMAKSFILLADIYMERGEEFQAVQTLQSIIDYYEESDDGILDLARRKKAAILREQESGEEEVAPEAIEIEIGTDNANQ